MSFLTPFLGGGGGGAPAGPLGAAAPQFGNILQQFGGGNGFGNFLQLGAGFLNKSPPAPAAARGPPPPPPAPAAAVPTDEDYSSNFDPNEAVTPPRPQSRAAPQRPPPPPPPSADYEDSIDESLTKLNRGVRRPMQAPHANPIAPLATAAPFTFATLPTLPPLTTTTASPKLLAHNTARVATDMALLNMLPVLKMIREISTFSDGSRSGQDFGSVQTLMEAFFQAVATNGPAPVGPAVASDSMPLRRWNDGTELGANRELTNKLFESDMVLTVRQMKAVVLAAQQERQGRRVKRKVITGVVYRWPNAPIPYRFKGGDDQWKTLIRNGLNHWQRETCVRWSENAAGKDHVIFFRGSGCYSSVGRTGGSQLISIGYGCEDTGIVAHEVGHSLGFWHEQSRPDRDQYIQLRKEWIIRGTDGNFERRSWDEIEDMGVPYDLGSVMHYGANAFTKDWDQITIATVDSKYQRTIGQRAKPSFIDVKQVNRLYCNNVCQPLACEHGGYADPNDCARCKCPDGLAGRLCEQVAPSSDACGGELLASQEWQILNFRGKRICNWKIKAPNSRIRFILSEVRYRCEQTCKAFVEVKYNSDFQQTGARACCIKEEFDASSQQAEMLVMSSASAVDHEVSFTLRYIADNGAPLPKPPPATWTPGRENRAFRGDTGGPVEKFILNSIPKIRDTNRPVESIASIVTEYSLATLFGISHN